MRLKEERKREWKEGNKIEERGERREGNCVGQTRSDDGRGERGKEKRGKVRDWEEEILGRWEEGEGWAGERNKKGSRRGKGWS